MFQRLTKLIYFIVFVKFTSTYLFQITLEKLCDCSVLNYTHKHFSLSVDMKLKLKSKSGFLNQDTASEFSVLCRDFYQVFLFVLVHMIGSLNYES